MVDQHGTVAAHPVQGEQAVRADRFGRPPARTGTDGSTSPLARRPRGRWPGPRARPTSRRCHRRRSGRPRSRTCPGRCRRRPRRTCLAPRPGRREDITWHVDVPITASIWPDSTARAAGALTCASTLPTATTMPSGRPGPARRPAAVRVPAAVPSVGQRVLEPRLDEILEARVQLGQELARRIVPVLVDALVTGRAGVTGLDAAQLPDDPVGGLDPAPGGRVDLGVLLEYLQRFGELPFAGDPPAVAIDPRLPRLMGEGGDPIGLSLRRMMLPQLGPRVGAVGVRRPADTAAYRPSRSAARWRR